MEGEKRKRGRYGAKYACVAIPVKASSRQVGTGDETRYDRQLAGRGT